MKYLNLLQRNVAFLGAIEGCTLDEIDDILKLAHVEKFPQTYIEFLLLMGRKTGDFMKSYFLDINSYSRNRSIIDFDLKNTIYKKPFIVETNMCFFGQWQGSVYYFICNTNEDPPVFIIHDFDCIEKVYEHLSVFFIEEGLKPLLINTSPNNTKFL